LLLLFEKLVLILVEAALETVPPEIQNHPAVINDARRRGKQPSEILLDRSYHHHAMKRLPDNAKRGRPDIVHFCLLEALGSPLNIGNRLETYVATCSGHIIYVNPAVRLPRVYERFKGVFEKLFAEERIVSDTGLELLRLEQISLKKFIQRVNVSKTILMSEKGLQISGRLFGSDILTVPRPCVLVGCFPHGDFRDETKSLADVEASIYPGPLEAWTVVSRVLCFVEQSLTEKP